jgi:endoglucanase
MQKRSITNDFLVDAVDTIRQSNPQRTLIVSGDRGSYLGIAQLELPENDRNLIVNFNYYDPYSFTHQEVGANLRWRGTAAERYVIESNFDTVKSWAQSHNRPVFLSEFGVTKNANTVSRVSYTQFIRSEAEKRGFSWGYWDFGSSSDGLYNLITATWNNDVLKALIP